MEKSCPKCGHRINSTDPSQDECPKCGIIYSKYAALLEKQKNIPKPDPARSTPDSIEKPPVKWFKFLYKTEDKNISQGICFLIFGILGIVLMFSSLEAIITHMYGEKVRATVIDAYTESGGKSTKYMIQYMFKTKDRKAVIGTDNIGFKKWRDAQTLGFVNIVYRIGNPEKNFVQEKYSYLLWLLPIGFLMMIYCFVGVLIQFGVIDTDS